MQRKALHRRAKAAACMRDKLMEIRVAGESDGLAHLKRSMSTWKPARLSARAAKFREHAMRAPISHGHKRLGQRSHGNIALLPLPALRHHLPIRIEQQIRDIRIGELPCQHGHRQLRMEVLARRLRLSKKLRE